MSKLGIHYLGRGADPALIEAGMRAAKWVMNPPPANLPAGFVAVWRWVENPDSINGQFGNSPEAAADAWIAKQQNHFGDVPKTAYIEGPNENDCENATQAAWLSRFEIRRMQTMEIFGRKCCIFNFGTGRPSLPLHDPLGVEIWTALLPALRYAKTHGHLMGMHAYEHDPLDEWNMLRYRKVYAWLPADARPKLFIGEWGREPAWRSQSGISDSAYMEMMRRYDAEVMKDDYVAGFAVFTSGTNGTGAWAPFDIAGQPVLTLMADYLRTAPATPEPPVEVDPDDSEEPMTNLLANGGFEGGTHPAPTGLSGLWPNDWQLWMADSSTEKLNRNAPQGQGRQDQDWSTIEIITRDAAHLAEGGALIKEGAICLKLFKGHWPIWFQLYQTLHLTPGTYPMSMWVFPDPVIAYPASGKVYPSPASSADWYLAAEARLSLGGLRGEWHDGRTMKLGQYNLIEATFTVESEGDYAASFEYRGRWGFDNNGCFLDDLRLGIPSLPEPPPPIDPPPTADCSALETQLAAVTAQRDLALTKLAQILDVING